MKDIDIVYDNQNRLKVKTNIEMSTAVLKRKQVIVNTLLVPCWLNVRYIGNKHIT